MRIFSDSQMNYISSSLEQNIYLRACPGAGKTEVIAAKVAMEAGRWAKYPSGMAVLSFSRSATAELSDRITKARRGNTNMHPHFVGTVDSFILNHLVTPLAHLVTGYPGKEGDYSLRVVGPESLSFYRAKYAIEKQPIFANRFDLDTAEDRYLFWHVSDGLKKKLNKVVLADWQIKDLTDAKRRFNAAGFATYRDVELLATKILTDVRFRARLELLVYRFPVIIVDECQDLSAEQIAIFGYLVEFGARIHLVGDLDQAIYGFRNCFPEAVADFIRRLGCAEMPLTENFRSGQSIVDLHGRLVKTGEVVGRANYSPTTCYLIEYKACPTEVLPHFDALSAGHGDSVIVARGHSTLGKLRAPDAEPGPAQLIAAAVCAFAKDAPGSLHQALLVFSRYLTENCMECETMGADRYYRPAEISTPENWHRFLWDCLSELQRQGLDHQNIFWKEWCKKLRNALGGLAVVVNDEDECKRVLASLRTKKHSAPAGLGDQLVTAIVSNPLTTENKRRLATIHEVKGETHDLTMLVSSGQKGQGSHWSEWLNDPRSEAARFAYVASSRPRHVLIWAVKVLKPADRLKLVGLGFQAYP
jgi:hypothetical protein